MNRPNRWLMVKILDIIIVIISTPLAFYVALLWDAGDIGRFIKYLAVLSLLGGLSTYLTWWVWQKIRDGQKRTN